LEKTSAASEWVRGIPYYEEGVVQWAPSLEWRNFPLKENLRQRFNLPVVLDNDVNISASASCGSE